MTIATCAILGAGAGVGLAVAREFARRGYAIVLAARRLDTVEALAQDLRNEGFVASALAIDCADPESIRNGLAAIAPVEVLVYNAAGITMATPTQIAPEQFMADLGVSIGGALVAIQAVAPAMRAAGTGTILLTGGGFALAPIAAMASLGVGKAGLRNLANSVAEDLRPAGIRVGTVTILGMVKPGTAFDPASIAADFGALHADRDYQLGVEVQFAGKHT